MNRAISGETVVPVALGARSYDIVVGPSLLETAGERIRSVLGQPRVVVICDAITANDRNRARAHLEKFEASLARNKITHSRLTVPAGEKSKSFRHLEKLANDLLALRIERSTALVAFGGGVVGDLVGFAASIVLRGIDFVQVPTTLLAQVDSSVGGKTGIDTPHGKNLIGSFHQPRLVLSDVSTLATLAPRQRRAGYAEIVKYAVIGDAGFFRWLERHGTGVVGRDAAAQQHAVVVSCRAKAQIVVDDERETGRRKLLNFGHTFAHAIETEFGYGPGLVHGEAVALGMALAMDLSVALGACMASDARRVKAHLAAVDLPTTLGKIGCGGKTPQWRPERLIDHMRSDKKVVDGKLTFILCRGIGQAFTAADVDGRTVEAVLSAALRA